MAAVKHHSTNALFWRGPTAAVREAAKHPGWAEFHRQAGKVGLFFDDIEPAGRTGYGAVAFRIERERGYCVRYVVAQGKGDGPIEAVLDALNKAPALAREEAERLSGLLGDAPVIEMLPVPDTSDVLAAIDQTKQQIAEAFAVDPLEGLLG